MEGQAGQESAQWSMVVGVASYGLQRDGGLTGGDFIRWVKLVKNATLTKGALPGKALTENETFSLLDSPTMQVGNLSGISGGALTINQKENGKMSRYIPESKTVLKLGDLFSDIETIPFGKGGMPKNMYDGGNVFYINADLSGWTYGEPCKMVKEFCNEYSIYGCSSDKISFEVVDRGEGEYVLFMQYSYIIGSWAICYIEKPSLDEEFSTVARDPIKEI